MRKLESTTIVGESGASYSMNRYPADMRFNDFIPGVFILFAGDDALYAGHSDNVDLVLQKSQAATKLSDQGFSSIGLVRNGNPSKRTEILADLESALTPSLSEI